MRRAYDEGFGLVEVIIAMLLLGVVAVAILPALWQGMQYSAQQSSVATATRHLNSLIEKVRDDPTCARLQSLDDAANVTADGRGGTLTPRFNPTGNPACPTATTGGTVTFTLEIVGQSNVIQASTRAIVYLP